jgi:hypothetical protein
MAPGLRFRLRAMRFGGQVAHPGMGRIQATIGALGESSTANAKYITVTITKLKKYFWAFMRHHLLEDAFGYARRQRV